MRKYDYIGISKEYLFDDVHFNFSYGKYNGTDVGFKTVNKEGLLNLLSKIDRQLKNNSLKSVISNLDGIEEICLKFDSDFELDDGITGKVMMQYRDEVSENDYV